MRRFRRIFLSITFLLALITLVGCTGLDGNDGNDGLPGIDGVLITQVIINDQDELIITFSDGTTSNLGVVRGEDGTNGSNGLGVSSFSLNDEGELVVTYSDKTTKNLGKIIGANGNPGADGKEVSLQVASGYIQWKYDTDETWINLIELSSLVGAKGDTGNAGSDGTDGKEVLFQVSATHIQWQYVGDSTWKDLVALSTLVGAKGEQGNPGADGKEVSLQVANGYIQWQYAGDSTWTNLIELSSLVGAKGDTGNAGSDGTDGKEVLFQVSATHIQWQYVGDSTWKDLVALSTLVGAKGEQGNPGADGKEVSLQVANGYIQWQYAGDSTWTNLIELSSLVGAKGENGKSAYEIYLENYPSYTKTETEWLNDLINGRLGTEEPTSYTVTFDSDGGSSVTTQNVIEFGKVNRPATPTKEGYRFLGWFIEDEQWVFNGFLVTSNITLVAKWEEVIVLDVTFNDQIYTYDGTPKVLSLTGTLPEGVIVTYVNNGKTNAGVYLVTAMFTDTTKTLTNIPNLEATLTINQAEITGISLVNQTYTYDGLEKELLLTGTLPEGVSVYYTNHKQVSAGTYSVTATFTYDGNNYVPLPNLEATLTINKATYDLSGLTFNGESYTYDGSVRSLSIEGTLPEGVNVSYENNNQSNAGVYTVTANFTYDETNYEAVLPLTATLIIIEASISGITFSDQTYTYDESVRNLSIEGTLPEGVSVSYENNNKVNAGAYTVTAIFTDTTGNYQNLPNLTAILTINKTTFDMNHLVFEDQVYVFDELVKSLVVVGTLPIGISIVYTNNHQINAGTYHVVASFVDANDNHIINQTLEATLTIVEPGERLIAPTMIFDGEWLDWDINDKALNYIISINGIEYTTTNNFFQVPVSDVNSGFEAKIKVISSDSLYHDSLYGEAIIKSAPVSNFSLSNDYLITWDQISDAMSYEIRLNSTTFSITENYFDLSSYASGIYEFRVQVKSQLSPTSPLNSITKVITIHKDVTLDLSKQDHILNWLSVSGVSSYALEIDGETQVLTNTSYDLLNEVSGAHVIKVYAEHENVFYLSTLDVNKLDTITSFTLENSIFTWDQVSGADGYFVYVNDVKYDNLNVTSFTLGESFGAETYKVEVRAYSNAANTLPSSYTESIETTKLDNNITVTLVDGVVTWNTISNASSYYITYGADVYETTTRELKVTNLVGVNAFIIYAVGNGTSYVNGNLISLNIERLEQPVLSYSGQTISWQEVLNATSYNVYYGTEVVNMALNTSYEIPNLNHSYKLIVEAVGNDTYASSQSSIFGEIEVLTVTIDADGVSWNQIVGATKYVVYVGADTYEVAAEYNSFSLLDTYASGVYEIKVIAYQVQTTYYGFIVSEVMTFNKLAVVTNIINDNGFITWDIVANATSYQVTVGSSTYLTDVNSFDADMLLETGTKEVSVQALNGDSYINSNDSAKVTFEFLDAVGSIDITDGVLSWDAVLNASKYIILVNRIEVETNNTSFELNETYEAGTYNIQVRAIGSSTYLSSKYTNTLTLEKLSKPVDAWIEDGYLMIDGIAGASGYRLEINGVEYNYDANTSFLMPQDLSTNVLNIRIKALGNNTSNVNSDYRDSTPYRKLATQELYFENGLLKWTSANHDVASGYELYINDELLTLDQVLEFDLTSYDGGTYTFKLRAIGSSSRLSSLETILTLTKLTAPQNVSINNGLLKWDAVLNASNYKVIMDGDEYVTSNTQYTVESITIVNYVAVISIGSLGVIDSNRTIFIWTENGYKYANYGKYPQTIVSDSSLIANLNTLTQTNAEGYYEYNGHEYAKVTASPYSSGYMFTSGTTIISGQIYYFKVKPIKWRVISNTDGTLQLLSEYIIDKQAFHPNTNERKIGGKTIYSNNYEHSNIRTWLNGTFYNKAFGSLDQNAILTTLVNNSGETLFMPDNPNTSANTNDKIYLLSIRDAYNSSYGFSSSSNKTAQTTDYARAIGTYMSTNTSYYGNGVWWLRSPDYKSDTASYVNNDGGGNYSTYVSDAYRGVRPALQIR
ncbi:DUF6273 domain-containing protein [Acholeplasma laidlawii]|uniref:DUF6273 domain-containing protein n=1 Tax=Acholeplasma laidlawii TaxID=2148 RepID=UPI0021F7ADA6|nr:DUF6273 domain-containing protein [Acholeplasma laidlawii]